MTTILAIRPAHQTQSSRSISDNTRQPQENTVLKGPPLPDRNIQPIHPASRPHYRPCQPSPATGNGQAPAHTPGIRAASLQCVSSQTCACLPSFDVCTRQLSSGRAPCSGPRQNLTFSSSWALWPPARPDGSASAPPGSVCFLRGQEWSSQREQKSKHLREPRSLRRRLAMAM